MRFRSFFLICFSTGVAGCAADSPSRETLQRDSAGLVIIESAKPRWTQDVPWSVAREPRVVIGTADGDASGQLYDVRDAARLPNGDIIIVNSGSHELRIFSPSGAFLRMIGRRGAGPGEFNAPSAIWILGDTLIVDDFERVSIFTSAGIFVQHAQRGPWPVHDVFADGKLLQIVIPAGKDVFAAGYSRPDKSLIRRSRDGAVDTLAITSGDELFRSVSDAGGMSSYLAPFGRQRLAATHGIATYTGDGSTAEVVHIGPEGETRRIIRWSAEPVSVTAAAIDSLEAVVLSAARTEFQRQRRLRLFREWAYPERRPVYDRLVVDSDGFVWVRHFSIGGNSPMWSVIDPIGAWLGQLTLPAGLNVTRIGPDYVIGVGTDSLGVESVQMHDLVKRR